jgi:hypothetical protein
MNQRFVDMADESGHGQLSSGADRVSHRVAENTARFYYARTHFCCGTIFDSCVRFTVVPRRPADA